MNTGRPVRIEPLESEGSELAELFADEPFLELRHLARPSFRDAPGREAFVLRVAGRLAGVLILDAEPGSGAIELTLAVAPEQRRSGLAGQLLAKAQERAELLGSSALRAVLDGRNAAAAAFFAARGFEPESEAPAGHLVFRLAL